MSVVVPAHDEERTIARCLAAVVGQLGDADELVVVCNGCRDGTAAMARTFGPRVTVVETAVASKTAALNQGDATVTRFPRLYLDADVELSPGAVPAVVAAFADPAVAVAAPMVRHDLAGASWAVRSYYAIWAALPSVRDDVVGRGAYALSAEAHASLGAFPTVTGDDHFVRDRFPRERRRVVAGAVSTVRAPQTLRGLVRRKVRARAGNLELDRASSTGRHRASRRSRQWLHVVRARPGLVRHVPLYVAVTVWARTLVALRGVLGRQRRWDRDDSARAGQSTGAALD